MSFQKTESKMTLDAHRLEAENKRIEESEVRAREELYAEERGLTWPPEENEEEWETDRQFWVKEAFKACKKVLKPMPEKPELKKPPPIDREAARDAASKIVAETDAFEEYENRMNNE